MQTEEADISQPAEQAGRAKLVQVGARGAVHASRAWAHNVFAAHARVANMRATKVVFSVRTVGTRGLARCGEGAVGAFFAPIFGKAWLVLALTRIHV